jgi:2-hydroxy-6-oxonona-2,4-dienedioate hydrolase
MDQREHPEYRWLERGEGEPVLLLHGPMGQMDHWDAVLDGLAPVCRTLALSMPIFDPALREPTVRELAEHVVRFLDALDLPSAVIGGNSLGGHAALEVALQRPERVSGLVLTGSSGLFERAKAPGVSRRPDPAYVRRKMEEAFYEPSLVTDQWVAGVRALLSTRAHALRVLRFARDARRQNVAHRLGAIRVPALLIWGAHDRITPPDVAERFRALISGAEVRYLARCGHAPMLERPAPFVDAVTAWLARTRERRLIRAPHAGGVR